jgi:serine/threonine protein kinase
VSPRRRQRFFVEMEALGRLDHPNIVHATDAGEWHGCPFLVMELLEGADLFQCVKARGPWPVGAACAAVLQAARGLQYAHEKNLVHRDIKPSNLFLTRDGTIKVLDLGLVRIQDPANPDELTGSHEVMGTYDYMAPEQGASSRHVDIRADLYSLGCTLFFLLVGRPPFGHLQLATWQEKVQAHTQVPPPALRELRVDVPVELEALAARLLAKKPEDRFATPKELADALEPWARPDELAVQHELTPATESVGSTARTESYAGAESQTGPHGRPRTSKTPRLALGSALDRRYRGVYLVAAALLVGAVALGYWLFDRSAKDRPDPGQHQGEQHQGEQRAGAAPRTFDQPNTWYDLLDQPPVVLREPPGNFRRHFDPVKKELWFDTGELCLLQLGETTAGDFDLEISLQQNQFNQGAGIFLGYQPDPDAAERRRMLLLEALQVRNVRGMQEPHFAALYHTMLPRPPYTGGGETVTRQALDKENVSRLVIAVQVRKSLLNEVKLNGRALANWPERIRPAGPRPFGGGFGVHSQRGSVTATGARYRWHLPEE